MQALHRYILSQPQIWTMLGDLESRFLEQKLQQQPLQTPLYITGLARSGTTIMLEMLAQCEGVVTHTYRDFPNVFTPYLTRKFFQFGDRFAPKNAPLSERAHKDRILVSPRSPEAMEEILWMVFFEHLHDAGHSQVLDAATSQPAFEQFYVDHIKKLLLVENAQRYLSKANYNLTRIPYLRKIIPQAKYIVMLREPSAHIASLMKQEKLFRAEQARDPRTREHMRLSGHFEFGMDRVLINTGEEAAMQEIEQAFAHGEEVRGWALYWAMLHRYLITQLGSDLLVVDYDTLCADPHAQLARILQFAGLQADVIWQDAWAVRLSKPDYYSARWSAEEQALIEDSTQEVYVALQQAAQGVVTAT